MSGLAATWPRVQLCLQGVDGGLCGEARRDRQISNSQMHDGDGYDHPYSAAAAARTAAHSHRFNEVRLLYATPYVVRPSGTGILSDITAKCPG